MTRGNVRRLTASIEPRGDFDRIESSFADRAFSIKYRVSLVLLTIGRTFIDRCRNSIDTLSKPHRQPSYQLLEIYRQPVERLLTTVENLSTVRRPTIDTIGLPSNIYRRSGERLQSTCRVSRDTLSNIYRQPVGHLSTIC